jgi:hypothetical protein
MVRGLVMDCHDSLTLTSLSLLYRFVDVLYIWTLYLQLNTFITHGYAWLRLVTLCHELHYFPGFDLYSVTMTLVDAT